MAVATNKRTQTNFDVSAVWQFLTWKNVVRAFVALVDGLENFWKRGTARFGDAWILLDGDAVVVALVVARVF